MIADYVAGAAERLVIEGATRGDTLLVEGQGALYHPAYSGVTLGLLHGCTPHVLVLCHLAGATAVDEWPRRADPAARRARGDVRVDRGADAAGARRRDHAEHARTSPTSDEARAACARVEQETGRVCDDPVRFGADRLWQAVAAALPAR